MRKDLLTFSEIVSKPRIVDVRNIMRPFSCVRISTIVVRISNVANEIFE